MKRALLFLMISAGILYPAAASAYVGLCCGKCGGNMPMNILGGGIPETKEFRFKLSPMFMRMEDLADGSSDVNPDSLLGMPNMGKDMAVPLNMDMTMLNLAVGYSFTDDFFAGLMFMRKNNDMDMRFNSKMKQITGGNGYTMHSEGMGDTMLMTKYRLFYDDPLIPTKQVSLLLGVNIPTGSIDAKNSTHPLAIRQGEQLPYSMQLGSGTWDPVLGIVYQQSASPYWWGAAFVYTGRWYDNDRDYRLGDEAKLDLYMMYQVRYDFVLQAQLNGRYWGDIRGEMDEAATGESGRSTKGDPASRFMTTLWNTDNYGGSKVRGTVGFQWQPVPLNILEFTIGLPLSQYLNGPQLKEKYTAWLTYYIEIPTKASRRYPRLKGKSRLGF